MNRSESKYFNTAVKMDMALMEILKNKSFEYITVSEICEKAGVNRSTFYLHYENTRDLLDETVRYLLDDFLTYFNVDKTKIVMNFGERKKEELNYISSKYLDPYLKYIKENKRVFGTAIGQEKLFDFSGIYERMFDNIFNPILERFHYPEKERKYIMAFYLNGLNAVISQWIKEDCAEDEEEIKAVIRDCIFGLESEEETSELLKKRNN